MAEPTVAVQVVKCPRCGGRQWRRERGPDCMYAVCRCGFGYDIGWGFPRPDYFPNEARGGDDRG